MVEQAHADIEALSDEYFEINLKDYSIETFLVQNQTFIKAQALLKNLVLPDLRRDISSWESILLHLKKHS